MDVALGLEGVGGDDHTNGRDAYDSRPCLVVCVWNTNLGKEIPNTLGGVNC